MKTLIFRSFRRNLVPGIILWLIAVTIFLSFLYLQPVKTFLEHVAVWKTRYSFGFSAVMTSIFGGLIPFSIQALRKQFKTTHRFVTCLLFFLFFWAWKGAEIDLFYQFQGVLWGTDNHWLTIVKKVAFDMSIFSALYAVPCIAVFNVWKDQYFKLKETKLALNKGFFKTQIPAMIVANCMVWIPTVSIVYAMPSSLQVVMFNLVLCFWVLIASMLSETDQNA